MPRRSFTFSTATSLSSAGRTCSRSRALPRPDVGASPVTTAAWIEEEGGAVASIMEHVAAALLPQLELRIEAGKKVMFGPFGVSKRFVYFNDKKTDWKNVTSMRLLTGRVNCLEVYCGGLLPWCKFHILTGPNGGHNRLGPRPAQPRVHN